MRSLFLVALATIMVACNSSQKSFVADGNPLIKDKFTADPAPMVHNDRLYLYVGHDEYYEGQDGASGGREFNITEWL